MFLQLSLLNIKLLKLLSTVHRIHLSIKTNASFPEQSLEVLQFYTQDYFLNREWRKKKKPNQNPTITTLDKSFPSSGKKITTQTPKNILLLDKGRKKVRSWEKWKHIFTELSKRILKSEKMLPLKKKKK